MTRPFTNVHVLDFTQVLAGPYGSYQLALLGADVIKVERREGEDMRRTPLSREWADRGMAPSVAGDQRQQTQPHARPAKACRDRHRQPARRAAPTWVMENFRPSMMDRLGIGYDALRAINPRLIYCTISGFGSTGPYRNEAGYDGKIQALSGIMSLTGHKEMGPTRACFAVCDVLSGMTAAFAVSSALFQRTHTGLGQFIDVSMLEASLRLPLHPGRRLHRRRTSAGAVRQPGHQPEGHRQPVPRQGQLAATRRQQRPPVRGVDDRAVAGRADVLEDPRFADWFMRKENEAALRAIIEEALSTADAKTWDKRLNDTSGPCSASGGSRTPSTTPRSLHATRSRRWTRDPGHSQPDGVRLPNGTWRRQAGPCTAAARQAHRRSAARGRLQRRGSGPGCGAMR